MVTARDYPALVKRFLASVENPITIAVVRGYLKKIRESYSRDHYALMLSALEAYLGRYKQLPQLISTFKCQAKSPKLIPISSRDFKSE
jgi:hypothetical protein